MLWWRPVKRRNCIARTKKIPLTKKNTISRLLSALQELILKDNLHEMQLLIAKIFCHWIKPKSQESLQKADFFCLFRPMAVYVGHIKESILQSFCAIGFWNSSVNGPKDEHTIENFPNFGRWHLNAKFSLAGEIASPAKPVIMFNRELKLMLHLPLLSCWVQFLLCCLVGKTSFFGGRHTKMSNRKFHFWNFPSLFKLKLWKCRQTFFEPNCLFEWTRHY